MLKVVWNVIKKIFSFVCILLSPLKRLVCRRKRRTSDTILPLSNHYTIPEDFTQTPSQTELQSWDSWGSEEKQKENNHFGNNSSHHFSRSRSQQDSVSEPEMDYFQDMTPVIKKQKKVLIKKKEEPATSRANKFAVSSDIPLSAGADLDEWDDTQGGWNEEAEEDLSWEAEAAIKEKKRLERRARNMEQQRRKQEKEQLKNMGAFSAVKLS